jgi:hypothetical protein
MREKVSAEAVDVRQMIQGGLVDPMRLLEFFSRIEDQLYNYPALDIKTFHAAVQAFVQSVQQDKP